jgi:hypothetical protein
MCGWWRLQSSWVWCHFYRYSRIRL